MNLNSDWHSDSVFPSNPAGTNQNKFGLCWTLLVNTIYFTLLGKEDEGQEDKRRSFHVTEVQTDGRD